MDDFNWAGLLIVAVILILHIALKRAARRARQRDREELRRHIAVMKEDDD